MSSCACHYVGHTCHYVSVITCLSLSVCNYVSAIMCMSLCLCHYVPVSVFLSFSHKECFVFMQKNISVAALLTNSVTKVHREEEKL